jgi:hypothetical protein
MLNANETQAITKEIRRSASLKYRAGAVDLSKAVTCDEYKGRRCVFYLKNKIEHHTAWFNSKQRALRAFEIMKSKYGHAIIYVD